MEAVKTALYDLTKYTVVQRVNTGDKTMDQMVIALFLAGMASITLAKLHYLLFYARQLFYRCRKKQAVMVLSDENRAYYRYVLNAKNHRFFTWNSNNTDFNGKLFLFLRDNGFDHLSQMYIDLSRRCLISVIPYQWSELKAFLDKILSDADTVQPIYVSNAGLIGIGINKHTGGYVLYYTTDAVQKEFLDKVTDHKPPSQIIEQVSGERSQISVDI